jgi:hypothetical protein
MEQNKGWNIYFSDTIGQKIAYRKNNNGDIDAWTEDKTHYTNKETGIIRIHGKYDNTVHIIKRMFYGEIIK